MTAFALVISSVPSANAAKVPSRKAKAGDECGRAGMLAPGRGAEGSTLTCIKMTYGTATGELRWWYKDLKPLKSGGEYLDPAAAAEAIAAVANQGKK